MSKKKISESRFIDRYIKAATNKYSRSKGEGLYLNGAVNFLKHEERYQTWFFTVKDKEEYMVRIKWSGEKKFTHFCNCDYIDTPLCPHETAALLYLKNHIINHNPVPDNKGRESEPLELKAYKRITREGVQELLDPVSEDWLNSTFYKIIRVDFLEDEILFYLKSDSYFTRNPVVRIFRKDGKMWVTATEKAKVPKDKLKPSEAYVLLKIAGTTPEMLDLYFNRREEVKRQMGEKLHVPAKDFDLFLKFNFVEKEGMMVVIKEDAPYYFPIIKKAVRKAVEQINTGSETPVVPANFKNRPLRIGYMIQLIPPEERDPDEPAYTYRVITGKPNKAETRLINRLEIFIPSNDEEVYIEEDDKNLIDLIQRYNRASDHFSLSRHIFQKLAGKKFVYGYHNSFIWENISKKHISDIRLAEKTASVIVHVNKTKEYLRLQPMLKIDNKEINPLDPGLKAYQYIFSYNDKYYHLDSLREFEFLTTIGREILAPFKLKKEVFEEFIRPLSAHITFDITRQAFRRRLIRSDYKTEQIYLSEDDGMIRIEPRVVYDNNEAVSLSLKGNPLTYDPETETITEYERNKELEQHFLDQVAALHPEFEQQKHLGYFMLPVEEFIKDLWFYKFFDKLNKQDVEIYGIKDLKSFRYSPYKGTVHTSLSSGIDWFDVNIEVKFGPHTVSLSELKKAVLRKEKFIRLKDGSVGILPEEWFYRLEKYFRHGRVEKDRVRISKTRFAIIDELFDRIDNEQILEEIARKRQRLESVKEISRVRVPKQIKARLRPYQKEGFKWLRFLHDMQWGGILADDMGLGKTLQVLTFLQYVVNQKKQPNLIVVPTTLLFNWQKEIEKFAPSLKTYFLYGPDRAKNVSVFDKYHLIITTYGTMVRDMEMLKDYDFNYVVLDESQAIKNPASLRYKAARLLKARNRIAMTGTPVENSTFDLYAQMEFVNPGFFGSMQHFRTHFANPIDKEANDLVAAELNRMIRPFILRRTKEQVARDLPPKTEDVLYCELEPEQRRIYESYLKTYRDKLLHRIESEGLEKSKLQVLEALTRLRQICDAPNLIDDVDYRQTPAKIKVLVEHITRKTAQHKILVFSQFVKMLQLIRSELDRLGIRYAYLDGKTSSSQRKKAVHDFQTLDDMRVFLVSLKAGGTGLNLTAADYVYLVDPWWNPAVETQAIDRTHRIGQNKSVFAYRMIAKDTVEEKILQLQSKKRHIADNLIQAEENLLKTISLDELRELFK